MLKVWKASYDLIGLALLVKVYKSSSYELSSVLIMNFIW